MNSKYDISEFEDQVFRQWHESYVRFTLEITEIAINLVEIWCYHQQELSLKPLSVTNNSFSSRTAAMGNLSAAVVAQVAHSARSRSDTVIYNWNGL